MLLVAMMGVASAAAPLEKSPILDKQVARLEESRPANRTKVADDWKKTGREAKGVAWYVVPALNDVMRLADTYPADGACGGELRLVAAKGEFESASFQLFAFDGAKDVQLSVSPLVGPDGSVIPSENVDLKVVKLWLQCGNAWNSYFYDYGKKLCPELLLHDEKLFDIDLAAQKAYVRIGKEYVWMDVPQVFGGETFDPVKDDFHDAKTLQPVDLAQNEFKQFFLTVKPPKSATPGVYRGEIKLHSTPATYTCSIPIALRVLDFELPYPCVYRQTKRPFLCSFMGGFSVEEAIKRAGDREKGLKLYRAYLQDLYDHGVFHPGMQLNDDDIPIAKEIGFPLDYCYCEHGRVAEWLGAVPRTTWDRLQSQRKRAEERKAYYEKMLGHSRVMFRYGDEFPARFIGSSRQMLDEYRDRGMLPGMAGHHGSLQKSIGTFGFIPLAGDPDNAEFAPWARTDEYPVGFYASQHNGSENPSFARMQHGLLAYLKGATMTMNFCFGVGPFNDSATHEPPYKPFVVAYLNGDGLLETLAFDGFREAIDDLRYATYLQRLCERAKNASPAARRVADHARAYLAFLDPATADLEAVRAEMIEHILKLRAELEK